MTTLVTTFYQNRNKHRTFEMAQCLIENCHNNLIDEIFVVVDEHIKKFSVKHPKLKVIGVLGRPTYQTLFGIANQSVGQYKIIANGDIFFKEQDIKNIHSNLKKHECYALSRWDIHSWGAKLWEHWDSQDAWIFKGDIRKGNYDYLMGIAGCDNKITYELEGAGYKVKNPSKTIKSYHLHITGERTYDKGETIFRYPPPYTLINCSFIGEEFLPQAVGKSIQDKNIQDFKVNENGTVEYSYKDQSEAMKKLLKDDSFDRQYLLTIAIPTMKERQHLYDELKIELDRQIKEGGHECDVQIYPMRDNGGAPIGWKRNHINIHCAGQYVASLDDDDKVAEDYISSLIKTLKENKGVDCVTFKSVVTYDGENPETITYHIDNKMDRQKVDKLGNKFREKMPSHLCAIKREILLRHPFKVITKDGAKNRSERNDNGTDVQFSREIVEAESIQSAAHIDKVLYYYLYNHKNK